MAHAYFPPPNGNTAAGDAHFASEENWKNLSGVSLLSSHAAAPSTAEGVQQSSTVDRLRISESRIWTALPAMDSSIDRSEKQDPQNALPLAVESGDPPRRIKLLDEATPVRRHTDELTIRADNDALTVSSDAGLGEMALLE